jgi:hypothetical protein
MEFKITYRNNRGEVMSLRYDITKDKIMFKHSDYLVKEIPLEDALKKFNYETEERYMINKFVEMSMVMKTYMTTKPKKEVMKEILDNI